MQSCSRSDYSKAEKEQVEEEAPSLGQRVNNVVTHHIKIIVARGM